MSLKAGVLANMHPDRGTAQFIVPSVKADQTQPITKITIAARLTSRSSDSVLIFVRLSLWLTVHLSFKGEAAHCSHSFSYNASLHHSLCHVFPAQFNKKKHTQTHQRSCLFNSLSSCWSIVVATHLNVKWPARGASYANSFSCKWMDLIEFKEQRPLRSYKRQTDPQTRSSVYYFSACEYSRHS